MNKIRSKVVVIGAGDVGSSFAYALMISGLAREIVLIDRDEKLAQGQCMDLNHSASFVSPVKISHGDYQECSDADLIVITAGAKQKPGQSRIELVQANVDIFKQIIPQIIKYAKQAVILVVTNPVDILSYVTFKISGLDSSRVIGSGTVLDSSRLRYLIGEHCHVDARNVHAYIIGEHGDSELAVYSQANIGGMVLSKYCSLCNNKCDSVNKLGGILEEVKNSAYKIIEAKGSTYYAIGLSLVKITQAILRDENSVLPVSVLVNDYYGIKDVYLSLPSVVNRNGVRQVLYMNLSDDEQKRLKLSASTLEGVVGRIKM